MEFNPVVYSLDHQDAFYVNVNDVDRQNQQQYNFTSQPPKLSSVIESNKKEAFSENFMDQIPLFGLILLLILIYWFVVKKL